MLLSSRDPTLTNRSWQKWFLFSKVVMTPTLTLSSYVSPLNRIFEKLIYKRLTSFFDANDLLYESQHDFREKHFSKHAITHIVNRIQNNMDKGMFS